jgi:ribosome biogenesis protein Tsr3
VVTIAGFAFSYIAGLSIGRFTALLPLLLTAFAVTRGRPPLLQAAAHATAIALYILMAWIVAEQVHYWGIQFELPLCLVAYAAAATIPPKSIRSPTGKSEATD